VLLFFPAYPFQLLFDLQLVISTSFLCSATRLSSSLVFVRHHSGFISQDWVTFGEMRWGNAVEPANLLCIFVFAFEYGGTGEVATSSACCLH
jgi:hypothetical protein